MTVLQKYFSAIAGTKCNAAHLFFKH